MQEDNAGVQLPEIRPLPPNYRRCYIENGRLIVAGWFSGEDFVHHVAFDLSNSTDERVSPKDLDGFFVEVPLYRDEPGDERVSQAKVAEG
nr:hypothetical protein DWF04_16235 [Cereibacter sphaeroides f. sp. denitrificans]